jgi:hypothetical protein
MKPLKYGGLTGNLRRFSVLNAIHEKKFEHEEMDLQ